MEHNGQWDGQWESLWVLPGGALPIMASIKPERGVGCGEENNQAVLSCPRHLAFFLLLQLMEAAQCSKREGALTVNRDHVIFTSRDSLPTCPWAGRHVHTHYFISFHSQSSEMGLTPWKRWEKLRPGRHKDVKPCAISWSQISRLSRLETRDLLTPQSQAASPKPRTSILAPSWPCTCPVSLGKCFLLCLLKPYPPFMCPLSLRPP